MIPLESLGMAPVLSFGVDAVVPETKQTVATVITALLSLWAVFQVHRFCAQRNILWPWIIVVSGAATFLLEPLYDHLYGLWFLAEGQWNAVTTFGIHVPIWLPIIYIAYYGCTTIWYWNKFDGGLTMRDVFFYFTISVALAGAAEVFYINLMGLYNYQDQQPFLIWNYPVFVAVINGVPPFLGAIIIYGLVPKLKGWKALLLFGAVPTAFAANTFGGATIWYLALRHGSEEPSMALLHATAAIAVVGSYATIYAAAKMVDLGQPQVAR